jgi:hypothetical protein
MNVIYQIWQKFCSVFKAKKINTSEKYLAGIVFQLSEDLQIDIGCILPSTENLSIEEISDLSEKYAELLILINSGVFKNQIFDMLKNQGKKSNQNTKEQLFVENVLSFDKILNHEINKALKNNKPLIRPISVFKN